MNDEISDKKKNHSLSILTGKMIFYSAFKDKNFSFQKKYSDFIKSP